MCIMPQLSNPTHSHSSCLLPCRRFFHLLSLLIIIFCYYFLLLWSFEKDFFIFSLNFKLPVLKESQHILTSMQFYHFFFSIVSLFWLRTTTTRGKKREEYAWKIPTSYRLNGLILWNWWFLVNRFRYFLIFINELLYLFSVNGSVKLFVVCCSSF